jgi:hypothetical protein
MHSFSEKLFEKFLTLHGMGTILLTVFSTKFWTRREIDETRLEAPCMTFIKSVTIWRYMNRFNM